MKRIATALLCAWAALQAATLEIGGSVERSVTITDERFGELPKTRIESVALVCRSGETKRPPQPYEGVLLSSLLGEVRIEAAGKGALNRIAVLVTAADGYGALFSYQELFNTPTGEGVLVVSEGEGFGLYSARDIVTGPRHVRNVARIDLILLTSPSQHKE